MLPTLPVRCEKDPFQWDPYLSKLIGRVRADSVGILSGIPLYFPKLRGHIIATIAVDEAGEVASFSNRCGSAADWCIAAPGVGVRIVYYKMKQGISGAKLPFYGVDIASGTSVAAPMVVGSLAVMKGLFGDQLSNTDLVVRLFATANKTGRYADKKVYGQGLLDLGAATSPVGEPVIVVVGSIVSGGVPLAMTSLASGKAFGDSLLRSVAGEGVVTFDALGAPFSYDLGSFVGYAKSSSLQERLQTLMDSEDVLEEGSCVRSFCSCDDDGSSFLPGWSCFSDEERSRGLRRCVVRSVFWARGRQRTSVRGQRCADGVVGGPRGRSVCDRLRYRRALLHFHHERIHHNSDGLSGRTCRQATHVGWSCGMAALWGSDWSAGWLDDGARKRSRSVWARCFRQPHRTDRLRRTAYRLEDRHMEYACKRRVWNHCLYT